MKFLSKVSIVFGVAFSFFIVSQFNILNTPSQVYVHPIIHNEQAVAQVATGLEKLAQIESMMLYAALPKPCDRTWIHEYATLHEAIMAGEMSPEATKYVIVRPHERAGLGNRIRAIHGAFAFAVLTERAILFDFHERFNDTEVAYLEPPLLHLFEQYKIDWRLPTKKWPHGWSPYLDSDTSSTRQSQSKEVLEIDSSSQSDQVGTGRGKIRPLRKDGVHPFYNNLEAMFKKATIADLKPNVKCVVFDSQNHDISSALFGNANLRELSHKVFLEEQDFSTWRSCAMRALFKPGAQLTSVSCPSQTSQQVQPLPILAMHVRSEGKLEEEVLTKTIWNETLSAMVTCSQVLEDIIVKILSDVINTCSASCLSENVCKSEERRCIRALQYFSHPLPSPEQSQASRELSYKKYVKWALLTDNSKVVTAVSDMLPPDKIKKLTEEVRVHSGLLQGGNNRLMGTALGPLRDLTLGSPGFLVVGSAGSSFSEVLSAITMDESPLLIRTPFIKSYQGSGWKPEEAISRCQSQTSLDISRIRSQVYKVLDSPKFLQCNTRGKETWELK